MKLKISVLITLCVLILCGIEAFALPMYSDNANSFDGLSSATSYPALAYTEISGDKYNIHYSNDGGTHRSIDVIKNLGGAFKGVVTLDYTVTFEEGSVYSFSDFPRVVSSDGAGQMLLATRDDRKMFTNSSHTVPYYYLSGSIPNQAKFTLGEPARFIITLDFDRSVYSIRVDLGGGFTDLFTYDNYTPVYEWQLNIEDISSVRLFFCTKSGVEVSNLASISHFNVYDDEDGGVYLSSYGNDSGSGSYSEPFLTLSRAEGQSSLVRLKDGSYDLSGYTFGTLDHADISGKNIIVNTNGYHAGVTGDYDVLIPELDDFDINSKFIGKVKSRLESENYSASWISKRADITKKELYLDEAANEIILFAKAQTNSIPNTDFSVIVAVYKGNTLVQSYLSRGSVNQSGKLKLMLTNPLPADFNTVDYKVKAFFWDGTDTLVPLCSSVDEITPGEPQPELDYRIFTYNDGVLENLSCIKSGDAIIISGTGNPGDNIALTISSDDGLVYLNQTAVDENGYFEKYCFFDDISYIDYIVRISSTGGDLK